MVGVASENKDWQQALKAWFHPRVITMLLLGFSAGIPLALIFGTLSAWLTEAGVKKSAVTFFSWAALGYSFKFVWAPLIDRLPIPKLTSLLGRRRAWLIFSQLLVMGAIFSMALIDPAQSQVHLMAMALAAVALGFSSATQDIVIDAYRIECVAAPYQAMLSASYIAGYRLAMLVAGAGAFYLADYFGSSTEWYHYHAWRMTYGLVGCCMMVGLVTTLLLPEPDRAGVAVPINYSADEYGRFFLLFVLVVIAFALTFFFSGALIADDALLSKIPGFVAEFLRLFVSLGIAYLAAMLITRTGLVDQEMLDDTYVAPIKDFFKRYGVKTAALTLLLVGFYRVSDIVLGVISIVFYLDLGFTKTEIATVVKVYGLLMTIAGGFLGGMLSVRYGVLRILLTGAILSAVTNLFFVLLAGVGPDLLLLKVVVGIDNLAAGLAAAAFVAFLSSLTSLRFTAVQYAVFSSLMTLFPKLLGGYSGTIVEAIGYGPFFLMTALLGVPVILLIWLLGNLQ